MEKILALRTDKDIADILERSRDQFVGAAMGVGDGAGRVTATTGATSPEGGTPIDRETRFKWGSFTKVATAFLVCQLAERGRIDLDGPASLHVPQIARISRDGGAITTRMLLAHTAGVVDLFEPFETIDHLVDRIASEGLIAPPGTLFSYSNAGYALLGAVLVAVSGLSWRSLFAKELIEPLGLTTVGFSDGKDAADGNVARDHVFQDGRAVPAPLWPDTGSLLEPAGSATSSGIADMLAIALAMLTGRNPARPGDAPLLGPAMLRQMQTLQVRLPEISVLAKGWGLGWSVDPDLGTVGHMGGTSAYVLGVPGQGAAGAFLANTPNSAGTGLAGLRELLGLPAPPPPPDFMLASGSEIDALAGLYKSPLFAVDVVREEDVLYASINLAPGRLRLRRVGERSFIARLEGSEKVETEFNFLGEGPEPTHLHVGLRALRRG